MFSRIALISSAVAFRFDVTPEKKSQGIRFGERAGHPAKEITWLGNMQDSREHREVCDVAPPCWNHTSSGS